MEAWTLTHTREEITEWGQANHHPWGPVATAAELLDNEQLWDRGFFFEVDDPQNGDVFARNRPGWESNGKSIRTEMVR